MTISISILSDYTEKSFSVVFHDGRQRRILNCPSNSKLLEAIADLIGDDERDAARERRWEEERDWFELCATQATSDVPF